MKPAFDTGGRGGNNFEDGSGEMIEKLPQEVVRKIASGQIASSPRAVLKELIENSLDAGARRIEVKIESPFDFKVVDDGEGIRYLELPLTVERFATSKIKSFKDLKKLKSYGFRGEALYAVAQVSRLTVKSRHRSEKVGGVLRVEGGEIKEYRPFPFKGGTAVEVKGLFFNTPVRRRATSSKERSSMVKVLKTYALCHPEVEFNFNGRLYYPTSLPQRLYQVTGLELKEVKGERVRLFYSKEEGGVKQLFVNGRPVELPEVERALEEKRLKSYVLFITVNPEAVDFNLSPTKERVLIEDLKALKEVEELLGREFSLPKLLAVREDREIKYYSPIELLGSDGTVIVGADGESYYFFDQHLVHERVNYERLLKMLKEGKIPKVKVHPPVELPRSCGWKLKELGITFREEGERLIVEEIPEILEIGEVKELHLKSPETVAELACKRALRAGYRPKEWEEVEELFEEFLRCENRETCPHGRPIYYKIDKRKVFKHLGRKLR